PLGRVVRLRRFSSRSRRARRGESWRVLRRSQRARAAHLRHRDTPSSASAPHRHRRLPGKAERMSIGQITCLGSVLP
ncbi:MAG TPA: hypothetical protein VF909_02515, partial [Roseiflexaceae bacterium]